MSYKSNIPKIKNSIMEVLEDAAQEIGVTELANMQSATPVKTGTLKRSLTFEKAKGDKTYSITWGSDIVYAPKVEFENKSYLRSTLRSGTKEMEDILRKHLGGIK
ncbi:MAG: HK97 gp10 family phage protein [Clostridium sp.]|uniref:HK97 gp10 family phage protein n=1 Tax=Clostridium sp. TaxID=1506 RepID=UPI00290CC312|nr:HK97 gp10 family phage protein [Clostridium sp.]MDU4319750.1 HK97 gp10 family phage protein [Clostridium sp.]